MKPPSAHPALHSHALLFLLGKMGSTPRTAGDARQVEIRDSLLGRYSSPEANFSIPLNTYIPISCVIMCVIHALRVHQWNPGRQAGSLPTPKNRMEGTIKPPILQENPKQLVPFSHAGSCSLSSRNQYVPFRIVRYHAHLAITSIYPLPFFFPFTVPPVFLPAGAPNKSSMLLALLIAVPGLDAGTLGGARAGPRFSPGGAGVAGLDGGGIGGVAET
jgi:hypothetical protein